MPIEEDSGTCGSLIRGREALMASGALIPERRPENLRDLVAEPASDRDRTLTDILLEGRGDDLRQDWPT